MFRLQEEFNCLFEDKWNYSTSRGIPHYSRLVSKRKSTCHFSFEYKCVAVNKEEVKLKGKQSCQDEIRRLVIIYSFLMVRETSMDSLHYNHVSIVISKVLL